MPLLMEEYLDRISQADLSPEDKQLAMRALAEDGILQNAPSQRYSADEATSILTTLTERGVIPELGRMESGQIALPQPTPEIDRQNAINAPPAPMAQSPATAAPQVSAQTPGAIAPGGQVAAPPGAEQQSFYDRVRSMGSGLLQGLKESDPVQMAMEGYEIVRGLSTPENLKTMASDWIAPNIGEVAGGVAGATLGTAVAGPVGTAAGYVLGSAAGSGLGLAIGRTAMGDPVTLGEVGTEAAISFAPEFLESSARGILRNLMKRAPEASKLVEDMVAKWATTDAAKVFDPPAREAVDKLFDMVHASNAKIPGDSLKTALEGFDPQQWARLKNELQGVATQRYGAEFGAGMAETFDKIRDGAKGVEMHIGRIQELRSQIQKRISYSDTPNPDDLARQGLVEAFDREIDKLLSSGSADAKLLKEARNQWSRLKASQTLTSFVQRPPVSKYDRAMENVSFDLGQLGQILREPANKAQKQIASDLATIPGAKEAFVSWLDKMKGKRQLIDVSTAGMTVNQLMGVPSMLGSILVNATGRETLEKVLTVSRGPLDLNTFSLVYNAARRGADIGTAGQVGSLEGLGTRATAVGTLELPGVKRAIGGLNY